MSKGLRVNVLYLELSYGITMCKGFRVNLFDKVGNHTRLCVSKDLRLNILISYGITMRTESRVNLFDKVGNHTGYGHHFCHIQEVG